MHHEGVAVAVEGRVERPRRGTVRGVAGWVSAVLLSVLPDTAALVPVNPDIVLPRPPGSTP
ncbi:MAG: hypothetical protein ACUVS4_04100 [Chloroflexaceae bacterium]